MASGDEKTKILDAAEKIMARQRGNSTIAEIAAEANVFDSVIYRYFKSKEDLLFCIAEERTSEALEELEIQLQGIRDPISKLSKLIWWQLYRHETNTEFSEILLFQCRSRRNYYYHSAFNLGRQVWLIFEDIVREGIRAGVFVYNIKIPAVRAAVFGLLDMEILMSMGARETGSCHNDLEDIMTQILPIFTQQCSSRPNRLTKKYRILKSAEKIFAEKGYENATIQDISNLAAVADGTIYEYFRNKEDLLFAAIKEGLMVSLLKGEPNSYTTASTPGGQIKKPVDQIKQFIKNFFFIYLSQPAFAKTFILQGIYNRRFYHSPTYPIFKQYIENLYPALEAGKADGSIRAEVNNRIFRNLVVGAFNHTVLRWIFAENESRINKIREIDRMTMLLLCTLTGKGNIKQ